MPTNLSPQVARVANKHSPAQVGDKLAAQFILSADAGNTAIAGTDQGVFVPAGGVLASMQVNALAYTFTTETGWIHRGNSANATFTFPSPAGVPLGTEFRIVNSSAATITLAGGIIKARNGTTITTVAPFGTLWLYRANDGSFRQTN